MAILFATCVTILVIGWLWFAVVRPILVDIGVIQDDGVNIYADTPAHVLSSSNAAPAPSAPSSLETDDRQTDRPAQPVEPSAEKLLTVYALLRKYRVPREEAREALKAAGLPLNNNVWARAEPPTPAAPTDDDVLVTPYAGRVTRRSYYDDPALEYRPPQG